MATDNEIRSIVLEQKRQETIKNIVELELRMLNAPVPMPPAVSLSQKTLDTQNAMLKSINGLIAEAKA